MRIVDTTVSYHPVNHPHVLVWPNKYKFPVHFDEQPLGGKYVEVQHLGGELICIDPGSNMEPPEYEPDWTEIILVRPQLRCWGRGLKEGEGT